MDLTKNLIKVNEMIAKSAEKANRSQKDVNLIAVTKYFDGTINKKLYDLGLRDFGENRVDNFLKKQKEFKSLKDITWHFIGNLQRRKVKDVINLIDYFHALDSLKLANEIEKRAFSEIKCFIEVNVSAEASKHGLAPIEVIDFINDLAQFSKIKIVGLMTMAPRLASREEIRQYFTTLKKLQEKVAALKLPFAPCQKTSMGMSQDFSIAVESGATDIRVGRILYE